MADLYTLKKEQLLSLDRFAEKLAALLCKHYSVNKHSGTDIASNHDNYNSPLSAAKTPKKDGKGYEFNRNISFPSRFKWLKQISICKPFSELNF